MTDLEMLIITYGEQTRWAGHYSEGVEAYIKNEDALSTLTKLKAEIDRLNAERAEALLAAERAREERNREHVRLNAEWMAKCEELRKDSARLDFMLENDAFTVFCNRDGSIRQCQLMTQDEDEEYHVMHDENRFFNTERDAIDAALAKKEGA